MTTPLRTRAKNLALGAGILAVLPGATLVAAGACVLSGPFIVVTAPVAGVVLVCFGGWSVRTWLRGGRD